MSGGIFITGAAGFIGSALVAALAQDAAGRAVVAFDLRPVPPERRLAGVTYAEGDIRDPALVRIMQTHAPDTVVHLASVVAAGGDAQRDYEIDVLGTETVLRACAGAGVRHLVVTSSGAAYGYHADNPVPLTESAPLRGNDDFPYARNKRLVEEMLATWRQSHPALAQTVFRPCTVLGPGTSNQITAMFHRAVVLGLTGTTTPFSLVADSDVVAAILLAVRGSPPGIYNLAGDGTLSLREIAGRLGKPYLALPPWLLKAALFVANRLGLTGLGPQHVKFIQYRPVLDNAALKQSFGYVPRLDAAAVFERYRSGAAA